MSLGGGKARDGSGPGKYTSLSNVFRDYGDVLPGSFGECLQSSITGETATELDTPPTGQGWFYLITAKNRLGEEGTGTERSGAQRPNSSPCP